MSDTMTRKDHWIPWYFVAFFVVLAIVDGIFVIIATSTHTGVITENAYQKGLAYNDTIEASNNQANLGWNSTITLENTLLTFTLKDNNNASLSDAIVTAYITRPTHEGYDFMLPLNETSPGHYHATIEFPLSGQWRIRIATQWQEHSYQTSHDVVVK